MILEERDSEENRDENDVNSDGEIDSESEFEQSEDYYYSYSSFFPCTMNLSTADLRNYRTEFHETSHFENGRHLENFENAELLL
jgi:hypothetical protein